MYKRITNCIAELSPICMRVDGEATIDTHTREQIRQRSLKYQRTTCLWQSLKKEGEETIYKYLIKSGSQPLSLMTAYSFYRSVC